MADATLENVVCSRLMGGLGNQMFQYAFARSIALRTGSEVLLDTSVLHQTHGGVTRRAYALDAFRISARIATESEAARFRLEGGLVRRARKAWDRILPEPRRRIIEDRSEGFRPDLLAVKPPVYLSGYWQSERYFKENARMIRRDFSLRDKMSDAASNYLNQICSKPSVSIHVRRGDYVQNKQNLSFHGVLPESYYRQALAFLSLEIGPLHAFIFSDDKEWVREHLKFDTGVTVVDLDTSGRDHEEMHLMAACTHHIISNSSFGWWGAWLGGNESRRVVAPKRWFADPNAKTDIVPNTWTRI